MYDFIIIGGGSAGCVLANRLSADFSNRVLLLEAGGDDRRKEISIPAAWSKLLKSDCDWAYETEPNSGMDGRRLFVPRGKMLGGSSSMNAMMYTRGHRADFDEWAALGNTGWSYEEVLPYFKRCEDHSRGPSTWRGVGGPLTVSALADPNPLSRAFVEAAVNAGILRKRRLQRCNAGWREFSSGQYTKGAALQRGRCLSAPGTGTVEPDRDHRRSRIPNHLRRPTRSRCCVPSERSRGGRARRTGDRSVRRSV